MRVPVIEMIEIGAGGGSIARVDRMGLLKVGPDSAGADPGPACYNLGGRQPTVTDADLLLGYLDAEFFLGGRMRARPRRRAGAPSSEHVARPLGLDVDRRRRWGIHRVVNENMAAAARIHGIERGKDLRSLSALRLRRRRPRALLAGGPHPQGPAHSPAVRRGCHVGLRAAGRAAGLRLRAYRFASAWTQRTGS